MSRPDPARHERGTERSSRLKPVSVDYLDSIGLPSKGDKRLLDLRTQETYFTKIVERYSLSQPKDVVDKKSIEDAFASISLDGKSTQSTEVEDSTRNVKHPKKQGQHPTSESDDLAVILMAMRKLREAIVASARVDKFALQAYMFIIRATILLKHMESYHPALLYLLHKMHPFVPLSEPDFHEFLGYYILDLACRQDDLAAAYQVKSELRYADARVELVLKALVHGNWYMFWALYNIVSIHQQSLMEWAKERIRMHTLRCLGRSYLNVDRQYFEDSVQRPWEKTAEKAELGWQLDGENIVIRKIKRK